MGVRKIDKINYELSIMNDNVKLSFLFCDYTCEILSIFVYENHIVKAYANYTDLGEPPYREITEWVVYNLGHGFGSIQKLSYFLHLLYFTLYSGIDMCEEMSALILKSSDDALYSICRNILGGADPSDLL